MAPVASVGAAAQGIQGELARHRLQIAGKPGIAGMLSNVRTTAIAIFASMGGLIYGYNQGMFGQILTMSSFTRASGVEGITNPTLSGLLTAILELGAWVGVLFNGYLADKLGRRLCVIVACVIFTVGVIVQANTKDQSYDYILAGRTVTGVGVGMLSMIVPLYNAELAPPEIRGSLVALQQVSKDPQYMHTTELSDLLNFIQYDMKIPNDPAKYHVWHNDLVLVYLRNELHWRHWRFAKQGSMAYSYHDPDLARACPINRHLVCTRIAPMADERGSRERGTGCPRQSPSP